jgi:hypothetical protein
MRLIRIAALFAVSIAAAALSSAQTSSVLTGGLNTPNKIVTAPGNSLLVAEAGTHAPNSGRISVIDRTSGTRHTLIGGLPSGVSFLGGNPAGDVDGPSGLLLRGNTLFVAIGVGDAVVRGPGPGLESPNPAMPSSPIFDSVLEITLPGRFTAVSEFTLTPADQASLAAGGDVALTNSQGTQLSVRLVANLPDYAAAPRPGNPNNVKASHIYGVELFQKNVFVADAGLNDIKRFGRYTGDVSVLVEFPSRPNPTPGPPFIEAVPDNIHRCGNRLMVPLLTGFPFLPNFAEVRSVGIRDGSNHGLIPGLTSAIDVLSVDGDDEGAVSDCDGPFYTIEFSLNFLMGAPGRLRYYSAPDAAPVNVFSNLITPTSMARDAESGDLFITNIGPGTVTRVEFP